MCQGALVCERVLLSLPTVNPPHLALVASRGALCTDQWTCSHVPGHKLWGGWSPQPSILNAQTLLSYICRPALASHQATLCSMRAQGPERIPHRPAHRCTEASVCTQQHVHTLTSPAPGPAALCCLPSPYSLPPVPSAATGWFGEFPGVPASSGHFWPRIIPCLSLCPELTGGVRFQFGGMEPCDQVAQEPLSALAASSLARGAQ